MIPGKLSVVIPTYKRDFALLTRALDSVRAQTYAPIDLLVVDDNRGPEGEAYSDAIREGLAARYPDVRLARTEGGHGAQAARNTGIRLTDGEFLAFLDDDDEWLPALAEKEIALLVSRPDAGMAFSMGWKVDENETPPKAVPYTRPEDFLPEPSFEDMLIQDRVGTTTQAILRRAALEAVGDFDVEMVARQDYEMWLRIRRRYAVLGVPEPLFRHFLHGLEQISKGNARATAGLRRVYDKYAADYNAHLSAKEAILRTLIGLYEAGGQAEEAEKLRRELKQTMLRGALRVLRRPDKWLRVLRDRLRYRK